MGASIALGLVCLGWFIFLAADKIAKAIDRLASKPASLSEVK